MTSHSMSKADAIEIQTAHFFDEVEQMIVQRLHAEAESDEGRAELIRSTGVGDPQLIDELAKLGVTADGLIAMRLFPLILVAWADNAADGGERSVVMAEARQLGIVEESTAWVLLDAWIKKLPPGISVDAWRRYTLGTFAQMSALARGKLIDFTEREITAVAKASGGHLGIGSVSKKERLMIDKLVAIMNQLSDSIE